MVVAGFRSESKGLSGRLGGVFLLRGSWLAKALGDRGRLLGLSVADGLIRLGDAVSVAVVASVFFLKLAVPV